jgi:hypothetical protein
VPEVSRELHAEWRGEALDGIYPALVQKLDDNEVEIVGICCLLSDQTLTPLHPRLQLDPAEDVVVWIECCLGESTAGGMRRVPYSQGIVHGNKLQILKQLNCISWAYCVGYGERRQQELLGPDGGT